MGEPHNPAGGPPRTWFSPENQPERTGRTPTKFLRDKLSQPVSEFPSVEDFKRAARLKDDTSVRDAMVVRLIQIAFTDRVIVAGRGEDSEPVERVSAKESLKAIEMLQHHDMGRPVESKEISGPGGGPIRTAPLSTAEQRALLDKLMSEPEDGKEPGGAP